jgi:hypothetical protein
MDQTKRQGTWRTVAKVTVALLVGLVVIVLLAPASGVDTLPPECYSVLGYTVPCDARWAFAAGALAAGAIGSLLWIAGRWRPRV